MKIFSSIGISFFCITASLILPLTPSEAASESDEKTGPEAVLRELQRQSKDERHDVSELIRALNKKARSQERLESWAASSEETLREAIGAAGLAQCEERDLFCGQTACIAALEVSVEAENTSSMDSLLFVQQSIASAQPCEFGVFSEVIGDGVSIFHIYTDCSE